LKASTAGPHRAGLSYPYRRILFAGEQPLDELA
jgi:hypothetical protein